MATLPALDTSECTLFEIAEQLSYLADEVEARGFKDQADQLEKIAETLDPRPATEFDFDPAPKWSNF